MPETWDKDVLSSMVSKVGYNVETQELYVWWTKNRKHQRSIYSGVPEQVALDLANAASVGGMLNSEIKNQYPHRYG